MARERPNRERETTIKRQSRERARRDYCWIGTGQEQVIMRVTQKINIPGAEMEKVLMGSRVVCVGKRLFGERVARIGKPDVDVERVSTRLELAKGCKFGKSGRFMMLPLAPASRDVEKTPCGCVSPQGCRVEAGANAGGFG